jgi:glucuronate isomerase
VYFRRFLWHIPGRDTVNGFVPDDLQMVGKLVSDVSYFNAWDYFFFKVPE